MASPNNHFHSHHNDVEPSDNSAPCTCSSKIQQILFEIQDKRAIDFDKFIEVGTRFSRQCEILISCHYCRAHYNVFHTLWPTLEHILALYEAACAAYSFTRGDDDFMGGADAEGRYRQQQQQQHIEVNSNNGNGLAIKKTAPGGADSSVSISQPVKIRWGGLELKGEDARLLVKVLLRRRLTSLGSIVDELHEMLMGLWEVSWPRQRSLLTACETSFSALGERLDSLMGLLK